jgi:MarR-like DNA-binding transcriptional regulator SgrR of sgrS sRNA
MPVQTSDAHLDEVRGRNLFGRERLLALFWSLLGAHLLEQEDENGSCFSTSRTTSREQQSAAVFGHVASLVASKMLLQAISLLSLSLSLPLHKYVNARAHTQVL